MPYETFERALKTAMPGVHFTHDPLDGPNPAGHTKIQIGLAPSTKGVRLSIIFGCDQPREFEFTSEEEAATFLGELYGRVAEAGDREAG